MTKTALLTLSFALLTAGACKKGDEKDGGKAKAAEAKATDTKLPKLNLTITVPGAVNVDNAIGGEGNMLMGSGIGALTVETDKDPPPTLDSVKSDADMYSPKHLKAETLPDGFFVTFENTGSAGTNYWVEVHRKIGDKHYKCSTTGSDKGQADAVLAACKSLK
jgi:hypothetical protein